MLGTIRAFLTDPEQVKFAQQWLLSWLPGNTPLGEAAPYVTFRAREWLEIHLTQDMSLFEYGSGGSTIFFANRVKNVVSVEHNTVWYNRVRNSLSEEGISNCQLILCEPEKYSSVPHELFSSPIPYSTKRGKYRDMNFEKYVRAIDVYPDASFDFISVDGRARMACIAHALGKIRSGGYLMLDNSEREHYRDATMHLLGGYSRIDFFGIGPYAPCPWQTSVWEIKPLDETEA